MPSAFNIPEIFELEIEGVIDAGYYSNKSEVVRDALRNFFAERGELRLAAAVELYKKGEVTLSRGAEIAGLSFDEFKDVVVNRGVKIHVLAQSKEEIDKGVELLRSLKRKQ